MKNIAITIFILLVVTVLGLYLFSFQVRQTESALLMTFGKAGEGITQPGWYFKWPTPIQRVVKFDSRMRAFEADLGETTTKGAIAIIVNTYIVWQIENPLQFFNSVGTVREAESKLLSQINDAQNKVIGQYYFSEFINADQSKIKIEEIQEKMFVELAGPVKKEYGIKIKTLGIKQLKISKDVSEDVFRRMAAERSRMTANIIAQGTAEAIKIRTDADSKKAELLAAAHARAKAIKGEGDAQAARYYKMLEAEPKLAMFLRDIDALKKILEKRTTIVFSADSEPFKLLKGIPDLSAGKD